MYKTRFIFKNVIPLNVGQLFERYTRCFALQRAGKHFDRCIRYFGSCCAVKTCKLVFVAYFAMHAGLTIRYLLMFFNIFLNHVFLVVFVSKVFQKIDNNVRSTCE